MTFPLKITKFLNCASKTAFSEVFKFTHFLTTFTYTRKMKRLMTTRLQLMFQEELDFGATMTDLLIYMWKNLGRFCEWFTSASNGRAHQL